MGETFLLTLEVDDQGSIKVQNFKKNVEDVGGATEKTGKQAEGGFRMLGLVAAKAGEEIGIPFRASHMLSTKVEEMAKRTFPAWGMALGAAGVAGMVAAGIVTYLHDRQQKLHEALEKETNILLEHTKALSANGFETEAVRQAKERLAETEKNIYLRKSVDLIKEEKVQLEELSRTLELGIPAYTALGMALKSLLPGSKSFTEQQKEYNQALKEQIALLNDKINVQSKERAAIQQPIEIYSNAAAIAWAEFQAGYEQNRRKRLETERTLGDELFAFQQDGYAKDLSAYERTGQEKLARLQELGATQQQMEWAIHQYKIGLLQKEFQIGASIADRSANMFKMMYDQMRGHDRKYFTAYKLMAESKAAINIAQGITKALSEEGWLGIAEGVLIAAEGAAQLAIIRNQTPDGGGGGGGSVGTYSADYGTGLPDNGGYRYYNYEQSNYGSGWRPGEGPQGDTYIFNGDVYDKESFDNRVNKSVQQNIKDRGKTRDAVLNA